MNEMLESIKADLTDRRMLPLVGLVVVALLAAIGYAVLGGSGGSSPAASASATAPRTAIPHGIVVSEAQTSAKEAIAETTDGAKVQRQGSARNPFHELPASVTGNQQSSGTSSSSATSNATSSATSSKTESSAKTESGSKTESKSGGGATKPAAKHKKVYDVALQFGAITSGAPVGAASLTPYTGLTRATPLPSSKERLIEFIGVTKSHSGVSASFAVDTELILRGSASCLPSTTQCQVLDLQEGKTEQLEYLTPAGTVATYELTVVSIVQQKASAATVSRVLHRQATITPGLMADGGALREAGLRFSSLAGVLVFAPRPASAARAHTALNHR
jgi:hypothetical protein